MSYILEALKKAEAERQLGATPTLHAPVLDSAAPRAGLARKPLVAAVGALAAAIAVLAAVLWQRAPTVAPAPAAPAAAAVVAAPARTVVATPATPAVTPAVTPAATPVASAAAPVLPPAPPTPVVAAAAPVAAPAPPAKAEPAVPPAKPAEEPVQTLADLPEPIRRAIPSFSMDGYMYSSNPADRLILIDKALRREGDEVAPGLVLEKLLPKGAVFSFRGYRYRVAL